MLMFSRRIITPVVLSGETGEARVANLWIFFIHVKKVFYNSVLPIHFGYNLHKPTYAIVDKQHIAAITRNKSWAKPGFEPGTSRTRSENHTPRPLGQTPFPLVKLLLIRRTRHQRTLLPVVSVFQFGHFRKQERQLQS